MAEKTGTAGGANEGEGNKTAAKEFNEAQRRFAESGPVEEKARDAEQALDGPERRELEAAEAAGKSHIAGEDPEVTRDPLADARAEEIRSRAYDIWEREGRPEGRDHDHWRQAEREIGVDRS